MSINRKIARASIVLMAAAALGYFLSMGKEVLVAYLFGISREMDAFYAALTVPTVINNVLLSTFSSVFIPIFIKYRVRDENEARRIASATLGNTLVILGAVSLAVFGLSDVIVHGFFSGLPGGTARAAGGLMRIISFTVALSGAIAVMSGILNAHEDFFLPALSPLLVTLATAALILALYPSAGVSLLAYGLLAGYALQFLFLLSAVGKKGYGLRPGAGGLSHPAFREMLSLGGIFLVSITAIQLNVLIDRVMASHLPEGSIAALAYADKLVQVPLIIFSGSIGTAIFPYISYHVSSGHIEELKEPLSASITLSAFVMIPCTALLALLAAPVVQLLFQRGAFTAEATRLTSVILICYSFQLLFYTVTLVASKVFLAVQDLATYVRISLTGFALNIVFNLLFIRLVTPPAAGIALSTSLVLLINAVLFLRALERRSIRLEWRPLAGEIAKVLGATGALCGVVAGVMAAARALQPVPSPAALGAQIALASAAGAGTFLAASFFLKIRDSRRVFNYLREKLSFPGLSSPEA